MPVGIEAWRVQIGAFETTKLSLQNKPNKNITPLPISKFTQHALLLYLIIKYLVTFTRSKDPHPKACHRKASSNKQIISVFAIWIYIFSIICSMDVHPNPGHQVPGNNTPQINNFTFKHWNINSLKTDNYSRVRLIESLVITENLDIMAISESKLDPTITNQPIEIDGYNIIRSDLPANTTHGGVLLYYKSTLALKARPDLQCHPNTLVTELTFGKRKIFFTVSTADLAKQLNNLTISSKNLENSVVL